MSLRSVDFLPFTRRYNPERGNIQALWPLYLGAAILFLQFLPWALRALLVNGVFWLAPLLLTAIAIALRVSHPPEPPPLVDPDHENKPLALRLY